MSGRIDSLDAKIVQYQYAIIQLQIYIPQIKEFQKSLLSKPNQVPLMQYIVVAIQQLFSISEGPFNARLKSLSDYGLFKPSSVTVPATVSHVPYDIQDLAVVPLSSVPSSTQAFKCLKLLELLCQNCLHAYLARLHQAKLAKLEQSRMTDDPQLKLETIDQQMDELATFLKEKLFNDNGMLDLNDLMFELPPDHETLNSDATYVEATLIDFDMKMSYYISKVKSIVEDTLNVELTRLRNIRSFSSPTAQINYLSQLPHAHLTMHLILALTLRLNEVYNITRRFGRQIYFPNAQHLYDSKLISQTKNPTYFKSHVLKDFDELANANKKNGTLIATITRFIRANSEFEVNAKNVLNITNILNSAHSMIVASLTSIEEFRNYWIYAEVKFRKTHSIPRKNLAIIHQQFNPAPPPPSQPSQPPPPQPQPQPPKESSSISPTSSQPQTDDSSITTKESLDSATQLPTIMTNLTQSYNSESSLVDLQETGAHRSPTTAESINASSALIAKLFNDDHIQSIESDFKTLDIKNQVKLNTPSGNRSRSSSQSSVNSNGSLNRRSIYGTLNSPSSSKRNSLYTQKNGSLTNFPTTEYSSSSSSQAPSTVGNRRRANSQPIRPTSMYVTSSPPIMQPKSHAASGAAAALVRNMNKQDVNAPATNTAIVRSSNGMVRRSPSLTKKAQAGTQGANQVSPLAHKIQPIKKPVRPSVVEEEGEQVKPAVQRMTANQRLQQHLKNASQQGSLVAQQKEQLKSVTVDVSELSQLNMKRYTEQPPSPPPPPPPPLQQQQQVSVSPKNGASVAEVSPGKITRSQMTKINTHKNSMNMYGEEGGPLSSSSTSSTPSTISYIGDKVRSRSISVSEDGSSVVKRVRFIGVPQYSEAEDAPSNYAQKILRNFAMLRPGKPSQQRSSFAQKEHLLKKEESISFRKQLHSNVPS